MRFLYENSNVKRSADFEKALDIANSVGMENISLDLIYPLPDLSFNQFKDTVDYVVSLKSKNIKHISVYNLEVHENTKLAFLLNENYVSLVDEDEEYEMYKYLKDTLQNNGYNRYEISNYAISGYESKHNLRYWNQELYLGFGAGASSFFGGTRYKNETSIEKYIDNILNNKSVIIEKEELDLLSLIKEYIILQLRKIEGLSLSAFKSKYKKDIYSLFSIEIAQLEKDGLLVKDNDNIKLTSRGLEVANLAWEKFI